MHAYLSASFALHILAASISEHQEMSYELRTQWAGLESSPNSSFTTEESGTANSAAGLRTSMSNSPLGFDIPADQGFDRTEQSSSPLGNSGAVPVAKPTLQGGDDIPF